MSTRGLICRVLHIYPLLHFICLTSNKILQLYSKSDKNVLCISLHYLYDSVPVNATDMSEEWNCTVALKTKLLVWLNGNLVMWHQGTLHVFCSSMSHQVISNNYDSFLNQSSYNIFKHMYPYSPTHLYFFLPLVISAQAFWFFFLCAPYRSWVCLRTKELLFSSSLEPGPDGTKEHTSPRSCIKSLWRPGTQQSCTA